MSVSTETYQAQYRVLEAFSLFNVIISKYFISQFLLVSDLVIVWGFLLFLLGMTLKHYYRVNRNVWYIPVTLYPWFGPRSSMSKLPAPISTRSRGRTYANEKADPGLWKNASGRNESRYPNWTSSGHTAPARAHTVDHYKRNASPRRK